MSNASAAADLQALLAQRERVAGRERLATTTGLGTVAAGAIAIAIAGAVPVIGPLAAIAGALASGYGLVKYRGDEQEIAQKIKVMLDQSFATIEAKLAPEQKLAYDCILATLATRRIVPLIELYAVLRDLRASAELVLRELSAHALITIDAGPDGSDLVAISHALIADYVQHRLRETTTPSEAALGA